MDITEYSEIMYRIKKVENKINKCVQELDDLKKRMAELDGSNTRDTEHSYYYDNHTPYFDVIGESEVGNRLKLNPIKELSQKYEK